MYSITLFTINERTQFKSAFVICNFIINLIFNNLTLKQQHNAPFPLYLHIHILLIFINLQHLFFYASGQVNFCVVERVTYNKPCTLPTLDLTFMMSKKIS